MLVRFLSSHKISTAGLVLSAISVALAVGIFLAQREHRNLDLLLMSSSQLVQPAATTSQRVDVLVDGVGVDQIWAGTFRFKNTGNAALLYSEFDRDTLFFLDVGQIIDATILADTSTALRPRLALKGPASFELNRELMNPGEYVAFSVLTTVPVEGLTPDGHVAGVAKIRQLRAESGDGDDSNWLLVWLSALAGLFASIAVAAFGLGLTSVRAAKKALGRLEILPSTEIPCDAFERGEPGQWLSIRRVNLRSADGRQIVIAPGVAVTHESTGLFGIDVAGYLDVNCQDGPPQVINH